MNFLVSSGDPIVTAEVYKVISLSAEPRVARLGKNRHQAVDQGPPVSQHRPREPLERFLEAGIMLSPLDIGDDSRGGEKT